MRKMYDSVNALAIPKTAKMVAGYIDGSSFKWTASDWARFPNAVHVRIARRTHTNDGHVLDVEEGIPTVWPINTGIIDWVVMRRKAGIEPTIYCNQLNDWGPLKKLFRDHKIREPQWWVARYDGKQSVPDGAVAKQYANPDLSGGHYDLSLVEDFWPGVDGPLVVEEDMTPDELLNHKVGTDANDAFAEFDKKAGTFGHYFRAQKQRVDELEPLLKGMKVQLAALEGNLSERDAQILGELQALDDPTDDIDVEAFASAVAERLGPDVGIQVIKALSEKLSGNDKFIGSNK